MHWIILLLAGVRIILFNTVNLKQFLQLMTEIKQ